jgi:uncharacterized membrane protein YbhN (UPF0104 family)
MSCATAPVSPGHPRSGLRRSWPWLRKLLWCAFFAVIAGLLVEQARSIAWSDVLATLRALPAAVLWGAGACALASHLLYATYDLLGRRAVGHKLSAPQVMAVTFVSYAFNLNLGALIGGVASRYRLYGRLGLDEWQTTRILGLSMVTNWSGYLLLGGLAFALFPLELPAQWEISATVLRVAGALLAATALAYLGLCAWSPRRSLSVRGHTVRWPSGRTALLQLAMSCLNWSLIAATLTVLLQGRVDFMTVLTVLLLAAVAGVLTHVPAGLGVLEAVFVALLGHQVAPAELIGTLLAYRALYYLGPLALAVALFAWMEWRHPSPPAAPSHP